MTETTGANGGRRRRWLTAGIAIAIAVAVVVGVRFAPSVLGWGAANSVVSDAEATIRDLPGVTSASADLEQRIRTRSALRRDLMGTEDRKPRGEVTVAVTLDDGLTADELATILTSVRSALDDGALDRHVISITYALRGSETRIFDGWGTTWEPKDLTGDTAERVAEHALTLPDGAWFDLDPTTFEQGQFDRIGPSLFADLLGVEAAAGYTIGAPIEAESSVAFLEEAVRMTAAAAAELDGPTALHLTGPGGASVLTATKPEVLVEALGRITESVRGLDDPDAVVLSVETTVEWEISVEGAGGVPTMALTVDGANQSTSCASVDLLVDDAERVLEELGIQHTVTSSACNGR